MNINERFNSIKEKLDKAKEDKNRAEIALENLEKQKEDILNQLKELNIDPENLESEIIKLQNQIEQDLQKAEELLPDAKN
ncbi:hypothetical protein HMPREF9489_0353 [Finegoldia magna SY403409CC001050417]|uniref:Viral A-type inclusion protein n=1 Tax=Finegoldia magna TaxID=1260 RepID=A0A7D4JDQ3_FINMA|nr:hypothetical protein [Finegoldia magna]EGS33138.1 hypothetical protein HMPREF9489_0353 [Finegoldia magna SY403409CC001050417]QKH79979.1 hypothetical protein FOC70_06335 [Finegoldia magna]